MKSRPLTFLTSNWLAALFVGLLSAFLIAGAMTWRFYTEAVAEQAQSTGTVYILPDTTPAFILYFAMFGIPGGAVLGILAAFILHSARRRNGA